MNINQQSQNPALDSFDRKSVRTTGQPKNGFSELGIAPSLLKAINRLKFKTPTPIQMESIPVGISGDDIIALAQTGSGKTMAYGIPMLQRLSKSKKGTSLVLVPTRELAVQVEESLQTISRTLSIRSAVLIGGASMVMQRNILKNNPRVIIATPGRLMDHIERRTVNLNTIEVFVLDEADRMLDMGFVPDIKKIMLSIPEKRQTMLFSATMPKPIEAIAKKLMTDPVRIETDRSGTTPAEVSQEIFMLKNQDKSKLLGHHLNNCSGPVLVFTRTKRMASKLSEKIMKMGFATAEIHSDRSQGQRRNALEGFKRGRYQILVATDIAARGIDVSGIELVVNYDMPANSEDYVHRIGRTGRAGKTGHAISFATSAQKGDIRDIERFMKTKLTISSLPDSLPSEKMLLKDAVLSKIENEFSRDEKPSKRKFSNDGSSNRKDFKKSSSSKFSKNRTESKRFGNKNESSFEDKPSKRREFKKSASNKFSKNRTDTKRFGFKKESTSDENKPNRRFSKDSSSKRRDFKKPDSKQSSFKRKDSKNQEYVQKHLRGKKSAPIDFNRDETTEEKPFWAKFSKGNNKKKSVGQGSGRKKRPKSK